MFELPEFKNPFEDSRVGSFISTPTASTQYAIMTVEPLRISVDGDRFMFNDEYTIPKTFEIVALTSFSKVYEVYQAFRDNKTHPYAERLSKFCQELSEHVKSSSDTFEIHILFGRRSYLVVHGVRLSNVEAEETRVSDTEILSMITRLYMLAKERRQQPYSQTIMKAADMLSDLWRERVK